MPITIPDLRRKSTLQANSRSAEIISKAVKTLQEDAKKAKEIRARTIVDRKKIPIELPPDVRLAPKAHILWSNNHQNFSIKPCRCEYCKALHHRVFTKIALHRAKKEPFGDQSYSNIITLENAVGNAKYTLHEIKEEMITGSTWNERYTKIAKF